MTAGLNSVIVTNNTVQPTNYASYKPDDMIRDTVQKIFDAGGNPTHALVSTDWMAGLYKWGVSSVRTTPT
ncbi:MAG: hypothetical protein J0I66_11145 [Microbacterium sp.]|nr:hypothetical protein [Microbacterium sp.]